MCKCNTYDPHGENLTGHRCYVCNGGVTVGSMKEYHKKYFCSLACFEWWYNR